MNKRPGALPDLLREVLGSPLCVACGACVGYCPYVVAREDKVARVAECGQAEGRCYRNCPRSAGVHGDPLAGDAGYAGPLGRFSAALMVRELRPGTATSVEGGAVTAASAAAEHETGQPAGAEAPGGIRQHGGTVTALMAYALRSGLIDAAVLTRWSADHASGGDHARASATAARAPQTFLAETPDAVLTGGGSKFAVAPTLAVVNEAVKRGCRRLGVVALPCQATALRKMLLTEAQEAPAGLALIIGLFCTWSLGQRGWADLLARYVGDRSVRKVDIPPPPAQIMEVELTGGGRVEIPLGEVRDAVRDACRFCTDMTSENADLAVGLVEGVEGWNTVLVRTEVGRALLVAAEEAGVVEVGPLDPERLAHLRGASLGKKRRAVAEASSSELRSPYVAQLRGYSEEVERDAVSS